MSHIPEVIKQKQEDVDKLTTLRTPAPNCPACQHKLRHTPEDWAHHPLAGQGHFKEHGAKS